MTRAEEIAKLNAERLRQPKIDIFEQSAEDQRHAEPVPPPVKEKPFRGGILRVDKQLKDAGVF